VTVIRENRGGSVLEGDSLSRDAAVLLFNHQCSLVVKLSQGVETGIRVAVCEEETLLATESPQPIRQS
jgi:hypothetical protein